MIDDLDDGEVPDFAGIRDRVLDELVTFVRVLRRAGMETPANASVVAARALVAVGFDDRERVRAALRSALVSRHEDVETFERFYPEFWRRLTDEEAPELTLPGQSETVPSEGVPLYDEPGGSGEEAPSGGDDAPERDGVGERILSRAVVAEGADDDAERSDREAVTSATYSPTGRPTPVDVEGAPLADDELSAPIRRLGDAIAGLRGRRWTRGGDERLDTRRALRRSFSTGGTVISVPRRERKRSGVRALVMVDVSQSVLDVIDRGFLVRFLRRAKREWRDVAVFFFDTSVREVTDAFDAPTPEAALDALERAEAEWGGGTRIGNAVESVLGEHPDAVDRDTVAFVVSDGLEVGEIDVLEGAMADLSRRASAVLWLNPLAASTEYEPTCRGMEVSLPYVDGLFAFTGADDVTEMARQLERQGLHGRIGYEHDPRRIAASP